MYIVKELLFHPVLVSTEYHLFYMIYILINIAGSKIVNTCKSSVNNMNKANFIEKIYLHSKGFSSIFIIKQTVIHCNLIKSHADF